MRPHQQPLAPIQQHVVEVAPGMMGSAAAAAQPGCQAQRRHVAAACRVAAYSALTPEAIAFVKDKGSDVCSDGGDHTLNKALWARLVLKIANQVRSAEVQVWYIHYAQLHCMMAYGSGALRTSWLVSCPAGHGQPICGGHCQSLLCIRMQWASVWQHSLNDSRCHKWD